MKTAWIALCLLGVGLSLTSCSPPIRILVSPEVSDLRSLLKQSLAGGTENTVEVLTEEGTSPDANVLRVTTTPGWNLPGGSEPARALPADADSSSAFPIMGSLGALGKTASGEWTAIPLLFDLQGVTVFVAKPEIPGAPQIRWSDLLAPGKTLVLAGSKPSHRQLAYFLPLTTLFAGSASPGSAETWFNQNVADRGRLEALGTLIKAKLWGPDTWFWSRADLLVSYKPGSNLTFLESYRDYELTNPGGIRRFSPLISEANDGSYAVAGTVVFLEYRGRDPAQAMKLIGAIVGSDFVKRSGMTGKWLAASFNAPEVDGEGAHARQLVQRASRFFPVTDRLPSPLVEGNLPTEIQLIVDRSGKP